MNTKIFEYKPKAKGWKGSAKIKVPSYKDRIKMAQEMGIGTIANADAGVQLDFMLSAVDRFSDHVSEINLQFGKEKFSSLEDLGYTKEGSELIMEMGLVLIQGIGLGNE